MICTECGEGFRVGSSQKGKLTCSHECTVERERRRMRVRAYGLSVVQYDAMHLRQGGRCAICGCRDHDKCLAVDHDRACCPRGRSCGRCVRGLVCSSCNAGLDAFGDDLATFYKALAYLGRTRVIRPEIRVGDWGSAAIA